MGLPVILGLAMGSIAALPHLQAQQAAARPAPSSRSGGGTVSATAPVVLRGVTVVDVRDGRRLPEQTVVIADTRIQTVGPSARVAVPSGAQTVDARGKYLIPGLWDMHAHTENPGADIPVQDSLYRLWYPVYIANGVTALREMAQRFTDGPDSFRVWQREVMAGRRVGPRAVGPSADLTYGVQLQTAEDAVRVVDSLKAAGMVFLKFHDDGMQRDLFFAIARAARRAGIPLVGHVPHSVTNVEAADSGMLSIEHINEQFQCWPDYPAALGDSAALASRCDPVAAAYLRNGTWLVPTLVVADLLLAHGKEHLQSAQKLVRTLHQRGITRILAGSDCAAEVLQDWGLNPVCHRGLAVLHEVILLAGAGLTPLEALQTATLNPAIFFNATDSLGTVAPGKLADLVLLDADPLADIRNVMKIRAVVANGRYFGRAALDSFDVEGLPLAKSDNDEFQTYGRIRSGALGINMQDTVVSGTGQGGGGIGGIAVTKVLPNSAAAAVGLSVGDIIVAINGKPVSSMAQVRKENGFWKPGQKVQVDFIARDGTRHAVDAILGER